MKAIDLVPAALLAACATPFPAFVESPADAKAMALRVHRQPEGLRATMRAVLSFRGMELPMTIRVWRLQPDALRVLVTDDLGGTLLHVVDVGATTTIVSRAQQLPGAFATSLTADLASWLFFAGPPRPVTGSSPTSGLVAIQRDGSDLSMMTGGRSDGPFAVLHRGSNGDLAATLTFEFDEDRPTSVRIDNHDVGFAMDLDVREWQPARLTPDKFRTKR